MLSELSISQFALVEELNLEFSPGLTVITGETGAGKSIMLDALSLALGARSDASYVRHGAKRADISACFDIRENSAAIDWLTAHELMDEDHCILRRVVAADGRSKAFLNGRPVAASQLKQLAPLLAEIHSQHGHQALLNTSHQLDLVDNIGQLNTLRASVASYAHKWRSYRKELKLLTANPEEGVARKQLLQYQVSELDSLELTEGEIETLEEQQQVLSHAQALISAGEEASSLIDDDDGIRAQLQGALNALTNMPVISSSAETAIELLNTALIHADEATSELRQHLSDVEHNPEALNTVTQRLEAIYAVARKHKVMPEALPSLHLELSEELLALSGIDTQVEALRSAMTEVEDHYYQAAAKLSKARLKAGQTLSSSVNKLFGELAMDGAKLKVEWQTASSADLSPTGTESVNFMVQTNIGQPFGPLNKVASGGELSRIALAISVVTASVATIPTLLFDEVDVGVGGTTASKIGQLMRKLGVNLQVLSVTHQPQVAAQSHNHWHVSKATKKGNTHSTLRYLSSDERTEELARMLGGSEVKEQTRANARALLEEVDELTELMH
ncbi:MAG: DNA repair protein RecN [Pseudomonadales bacterium]